VKSFSADLLPHKLSMFSLAAPGAAMGQDKEGGKVGNSLLKNLWSSLGPQI